MIVYVVSAAALRTLQNIVLHFPPSNECLWGPLGGES